MSKKLLVSILALVMVVSLVPITAFAQEFADMPNDWSTEALEKAAENGLLQGYDGKIWPSKNLTRAEMATVINRSFGAYAKASLEAFDDMEESKWYYDEMAKAVQMRTFKGDGKNLNPNNNITREEAFVVLARALKLSPSNTRPAGFTDLASISTWATSELYAMINEGYVAGSNGKLNPKAYITRAEFAKVMDNVIKHYIVEEGLVTEVVEGNIMVNVPGVELKDVIIKGDLIVGDGVGDGNLTLNNTVIEGRLVVRGGGENSIIIKGNSEVTSIVIARVDGVVRVYNEAGIEIGEVVVDGEDDVILEGDFADVTILAASVDVYAVSATVETSTIQGESSKLIVDSASQVTNVVVEAAGVTVKGEGTVDNVEVKDGGDNVIITTANTVIAVTAGVDNVKGTGDVVVEPEVEYKNGATTSTPAQPVATTPPVIGGGGYVPVAPTLVSASLYYDESGVITKTGDASTLNYEVLLGSNITKLEATFSEAIELEKLVIKNYDENGEVVIDKDLLDTFSEYSSYFNAIEYSNSGKTITFNIDGGKELSSDRIDRWSTSSYRVDIQVTVIDTNDSLSKVIDIVLQIPIK